MQRSLMQGSRAMGISCPPIGVLSERLLATVTPGIAPSLDRAAAGLLFPSLNVHANHEEPQGQREFPREAEGQKVAEQKGPELRRKEVREAVGQIEHTRDGQQHAYYSWKKRRPENEGSN